MIGKGEAYSHLAGVERLLKSFSSQHGKRLLKVEVIYLEKGLQKNHGKIARFYMLIKIHKTPSKFPPIVATCGTTLLILSSWLDYKSQQLKPFMSTYIKDSDDFQEQLEDCGQLPPNAKGFTADVNSMYSNIDTKHLLEILRKFLEELDEEGNLTPDFNNKNMILKATTRDALEPFQIW